MGPYWFGPPRATFTVSGGVLRVFSILHHHRFLTPAIPLCGLPFSSKQHLATALTCAGECTSPGVPFPLQRSTTGGARIPRWCLPHHRHFPFAGFLTLSTACFALDPVRLLRRDFARRSSRLRSWGSPGFLRLASRFAARAGPTDSGFPLQGSPQSRDEHVFARSPLVRFAGAFRESFRDPQGR